MVDLSQQAAAVAPANGTGQPDGQVQQPATPNPQGQEQKVVPIAAMHEERTKRQELQSELETVKAQLERLQQTQLLSQIQQQAPAPGYGYTPQQQVRPNYGQPTPPVQPIQQDDLWDRNPQAAVDRQILAAMQWRDQVDVQLESQLNEAASKYKDFSAVSEDVRKILRTVPLAQRAAPGMAEMAYLVVKGQKAPILMANAAEHAASQQRAAAAASGLGAGMMSGGMDSKPQLSQAEIDQCAKMGVSPEEYLKYKR